MIASLDQNQEIVIGHQPPDVFPWKLRELPGVYVKSILDRMKRGLSTEQSSTKDENNTIEESTNKTS